MVLQLPDGAKGSLFTSYRCKQVLGFRIFWSTENYVTYTLTFLRAVAASSFCRMLLYFPKVFHMHDFI